MHHLNVKIWCCCWSPYYIRYYLVYSAQTVQGQLLAYSMLDLHPLSDVVICDRNMWFTTEKAKTCPFSWLVVVTSQVPHTTWDPRWALDLRNCTAVFMGSHRQVHFVPYIGSYGQINYFLCIQISDCHHNCRHNTSVMSTRYQYMTSRCYLYSTISLMRMLVELTPLTFWLQSLFHLHGHRKISNWSQKHDCGYGIFSPCSMFSYSIAQESMAMASW
jgi:hypothetical protein